MLEEIDKDTLARAVALLKQGELVAFPTETVYGLGADATNQQAVASIFRVKGRPQCNPLIVHVASLKQARRFGVFCPVAEKLAAAFWPGSLTLVVPVQEGGGLASAVSANLGTVALRIPDHVAALSLLEGFGGGLAAPSANPSGQLSPTEAEHVEGSLGDKVSLILDGGMCGVGLESTIISVIDGVVCLLRTGGIALSAIEQAVGGKVSLPKTSSSAKPQAPGQLESHYAPRAKLRLNAMQSGAGEMLLAFGTGGPEKVPGLNLSPSADLDEAATNLYAYLHILDETGVGVINVMPVPHKGVGIAINDRLKRAAAPRGS